MIERFAWQQNGAWVHGPFSNGYVEPDGSFVEREYQAYAKTVDPAWRKRILACTEPFGPTGAKRMGRRVELRWDHRSVRFQVMAFFVYRKFKEWPELRAELLATEGLLIEGNTWHDNLWGTCTCNATACREPGLNWLGLILMTVREGLRGYGSSDTLELAANAAGANVQDPRPEEDAAC